MSEWTIECLTDLRAERDALRAVIARVEGLAAEADSRLDWHLKVWRQGEARYVPLSALRDALGSTDSDPAATERQGTTEGAGDHV